MGELEFWIAVLATILFSYFAIVSLYAALKSYRDEEEVEFDEAFSYGDGIFAFIGLFFSFVLWVSEKIFAPKYQLLVFRIVAILTSVVMVGVIYLFWYLYFNFK